MYVSRAEFIRIVGPALVTLMPTSALAAKKVVEVDDDDDNDKGGMLSGITGIFKKKPYKRQAKESDEEKSRKETPKVGPLRHRTISPLLSVSLCLLARAWATAAASYALLFGFPALKRSVLFRRRRGPPRSWRPSMMT